MNQRHLEYFLEVYQYGSIKVAADNLHISSQGLSKTIIALEEELGETLFDRTGKKLTPTKTAINLKQHAQTIQEEYDIITNKRFISTPEKRSIKIATTYYVLQYLTIDFIKHFQEAHPNILLNISEITDRMAIERLANKEVELAILPSPIDTTSFNMQYLYTNRYCIVVNKNNPLSKKSKICYEDLNHALLAVKGREFALFDLHQNKLIQHGVEATNYLETSNYYIIHRMAEKNLAIGISLDYIAFEDPCPNTVILPFDDKQLIKDMYLVEQINTILSPEAVAFKNFTLSWLEQHRKDLFHWSVD